MHRPRAHDATRLSAGARLEASTMAFYVTIVLLATTSLLGDHDTEEIGILALVWGETIGLALAHFFAFVLAVHLVRGGAVGKRDWEIAREQLGGALSVAAICTVPIVVLPTSSELDGVRLTLALVLGLAGFEAARAGGAARARSVAVGGTVLLAGVALALFKNLVASH